jgi:hypothetical protein
VDGDEGHGIQNCQDAKKLDAFDATRDEGADREGDYPTGAKSVIAASIDVVQPGEFIIRVSTIECSAFSFKCRGSKSAGS